MELGAVLMRGARYGYLQVACQTPFGKATLNA